MAITNLDSLELSGEMTVGGVSQLKVAKVALGATAGAAGLLNWANPESGAIIVVALSIDLTTPASSASGVANFGTATSGTGTSSDDVIDGASIASAAVLDNVKNAGTNGTSHVKIPAGQYLTGTATTNPVSAVGNVYIQYIPA